MGFSKYMRLGMTITATSLIFVMIGQGCGKGLESTSPASSSTAILSGDGQCVVDSKGTIIDKNYVPGADQQTASILYGDQLLDTLVSCSGLGTPSQTTVDTWSARKQALSEYGALTDVSGALMMAVAAISVEVCNDLVTAESQIAGSQRAIFTMTDLASQGGLLDSEIQDSANRLALGCWQRNPEETEITNIKQTIGSLGLSSRAEALALCTAMLSSFATIQQ